MQVIFNTGLNLLPFESFCCSVVYCAYVRRTNFKLRMLICHRLTQNFSWGGEADLEANLIYVLFYKMCENLSCQNLQKTCSWVTGEIKTN